MTAYPLTWPAGWKRTPAAQRKRAKFSKKTREYYSGGTGSYLRSSAVTIAEGTKRVLSELQSMGLDRDDILISTNLELKLDGLPRSNQKEPADPGVAIYWKKRKDAQHKVMAIDLYDTIADNLAAVAATLDAMRAIERHGGAVILERAFTGFSCLPAPNTWRAVMGLSDTIPCTLEGARMIYRRLSRTHHPDVGGSESKMAELNWAMAEAEKELLV